VSFANYQDIQLSLAGPGITRYVTNKQDDQLQDCFDAIESLETEIAGINEEMEATQRRIAAIEKQISESAVVMSNIRENLKARKLQKEFKEVEEKLAELDMEEAYKARRIFDAKIKSSKEQESKYQGEVSLNCHTMRS
jgi:DNA repair protein RAD50